MSNILYNAYIYFMKLNHHSLNYKDIKTKNTNINVTQTKLKVDNIIGMYDTKLHIWYNGWAIYDSEFGQTNKYKLSKDLLLYGLNIQRDMRLKSEAEKALIKSILVNSKFYITEKKTQLYVILALIMYLTKAKNYLILKEGSIIIYAVEINTIENNTYSQMLEYK